VVKGTQNVFQGGRFQRDTSAALQLRSVERSGTSRRNCLSDAVEGFDEIKLSMASAGTNWVLEHTALKLRASVRRADPKSGYFIFIRRRIAEGGYDGDRGVRVARQIRLNG
jgi:hypothetical protein